MLRSTPSCPLLTSSFWSCIYLSHHFCVHFPICGKTRLPSLSCMCGFPSPVDAFCLCPKQPITTINALIYANVLYFISSVSIFFKLFKRILGTSTVFTPFPACSLPLQHPPCPPMVGCKHIYISNTKCTQQYISLKYACVTIIHEE